MLSSSPPKGKRILVVEDEPSMRKLLGDVLAIDEHDVTLAPDALAALKHLEEASFDLIISDIKMPRMSGRELYERILLKRPALARRMVFITGDLLNPTTQAFIKLNDHRVLEKPCSTERIRAEVAAALRDIAILDNKRRDPT
jgi:two-component system NtrC family sensor kinase